MFQGSPEWGQDGLHAPVTCWKTAGKHQTSRTPAFACSGCAQMKVGNWTRIKDGLRFEPVFVVCASVCEKTRSLPQTDFIFILFMSIFLVLVPLLHLEKWKKEPLSFSPWRVSILMARSHFSTTTRRDFCVMVAERRRSDGAFQRSMSTFRRWESCRNQEKSLESPSRPNRA